jgi:hypothetical protein
VRRVKLFLDGKFTEDFPVFSNVGGRRCELICLTQADLLALSDMLEGGSEVQRKAFAEVINSSWLTKFVPGSA